MVNDYDITEPDKAMEWICHVLEIEPGQLIDDYVLKCGTDLDVFYEMYYNKLKKIDTRELNLVVIHVTSNNDNCENIQKYGIKNLQSVLAEKNELSEFLKNKGISFNILEKKMYINDNEYEICYDDLLIMKCRTNEQNKLKKIAHKIYFDYQINGFFYNENILNYGTNIHKNPEFLLTLSEFDETTYGLDKEWGDTNRGYVIKYKTKIENFAEYTFELSKIEMEEELNGKGDKIKKFLLTKAMLSCFGKTSEIFAYMKPDKIIKPNEIIECISVDDWLRE